MTGMDEMREKNCSHKRNASQPVYLCIACIYESKCTQFNLIPRHKQFSECGFV